MKKIIGAILMVLVLTMACNNVQNTKKQDKEKELVVASFEHYKAAILKDDGREAEKYIDDKTIEYYSKLLEDVLTTDSTQLSSLGVMHKLLVLNIRGQVPKEDLVLLDGKGLLIYTINAGMTNRDITEANIKNITVDGNFAQGQLLKEGRITPVMFDFYKRNKEWKIDLTSIFEITNIGLNEAIEKSGMEEDKCILKMLEPFLGDSIDNKIWHPLN